MTDPDQDLEKAVNYIAQSETKRVFEIVDSFKPNAAEIESATVDENYQAVLTMSSIGQFGRFGNQLFQYAYLRICAAQSDVQVECPAWIGQTLFGHHDAPITRRLPPSIECQNEGENLFEAIPEFIPYLEKLANQNSNRVDSKALATGLSNVDLWGFFQFHTRHFKPYQEYFRSLFQPVDDLKLSLEAGLNILRSKGKTIVGLHLRKGDYLTEPLIGFTLVFPTKWYCQFLETIWDELEDPVLLLCSDDLESIIDDFKQFSPLTSQDLNIQMPERFANLGVDFYPDFFLLSKCDVVITSNSIFSFAASMLNEQGTIFFRPVWDFSQKFAEFDPWDSKPLLWFGGKNHRFVKSFADAISIIYRTQGNIAVLKNLLIYIPLSYLKVWAIRSYLGYQINGVLGIMRILLSMLAIKN